MIYRPGIQKSLVLYWKGTFFGGLKSENRGYSQVPAMCILKCMRDWMNIYILYMCCFFGCFPQLPKWKPTVTGVPASHPHYIYAMYKYQIGCWNPSMKRITSWWFQPIWKILVKMDHFPKVRGENKQYLKPPPKSVSGDNSPPFHHCEAQRLSPGCVQAWHGNPLAGAHFKGWYCWWLKSCTTWDVWNPKNYGINYL